MCGITGIYSFSGPIRREAIDCFTDALAHRGPDGRGTYINQNVALGHRRLSILDLSDAGTCPMRYVSPGGRELYITFNGEIFNFIELRRELEAKGHRFRSATDTEVIAAAYAEWGKACQDRFNGMWAFAIFDPESRELFLSRDRFAVKPLYIHVDSNCVSFASEIKAFVSLKNATLSFNPDIVPKLWQSCRYDGPTAETAAKEVTCVPGGHYVTVRASGEVKIERWWDTLENVPQIPTDYGDQIENFRDLFLDSIRIRMRSDVPVATCLSGGIDSTAVATGMHHLMTSGMERGDRIADNWQNTFVATFPGMFLDEEKYADEVVRTIGARPHYLPIGGAESLPYVVENVWCLDEPTGGLAVSTWMLYRSMRQNNIVVSLDGHGGDELLGGYGWYLDLPFNHLNTTLYNDFHLDLLPCILRNYDRCSSAHGIEVRMPLMDYRLVTYVQGLTAAAKIGGGVTKRILRDAMAGIMPETIRQRQGKIGFNSPLIEWLNGGLAPLIERVFNHEVYLSTPYLDVRAIRDQVLERCRAKAWTRADWDTAYKVTVLLNLSLWRMLFVERCRDVVDGVIPTGHQQSAHTPVSQPLRGSQVLRSSPVRVVYVSPEPTLPAADASFLLALAKAQLTKPLEFSLEVYCDEADTNLPTGVLKNYAGTRQEAMAVYGTMEAQLVLSAGHGGSFPSLGAKRLFALEGSIPDSQARSLRATTFSMPDALVECVAQYLDEVNGSAGGDHKVKISRVNELVTSAARALKGGDLSRAQVLVDEALSLNLVVRDLHFVRGLLCLELKKPSEAREALTVELQHFPDRVEVADMLRNVPA